MVCPEWQSRSSGGRSAVSTSSGTPVSCASTIAGRKFAAAVPDVQRSATGRRCCLARPSAKNAAERSSSTGMDSMRGCRAKAIVSGADREPGEITAWRNPSCASVSTSTLPHRLFVLRKSSEASGGWFIGWSGLPGEL